MMGVFAVIGAMTVLCGCIAGNGRTILIGAILFGIGVAGDQNGY
jgi:hypothetical protein